MNRKLIMSIGMLVFMAAVVAGGTGAFFSDTETSTGNVFSAGSVTLAITDISHAYAGSPTNAPVYTEPNSFSFSLADLKPLDKGTVTYNLNNGANEAYVCAMITQTASADNTVVNPEADLGDTIVAGELGDFLNFNFGTQSGSLTAISGVWQTVGTIAPNSPTGSAINYCFGAFSGNNCVIGTGDDNLAQTDSLTADVKFYAVQTRNNPNFTCASLNTPEVSVGAVLGAYVAPEVATCDVSVDDNGGNPALDTIQEGVDLALAGQTVCVAAGTYAQDVNINKSLTLSGAGSSLTSLTGVGTGFGGAMTVAPGIDNVVIEGFTVNGTGESALYLTSDNGNVSVRYNNLVSANSKNAVLTGGQQANNTFSNNVFGGNSSQMVYVNGSASLGLPNASTNVDFSNNTFGGSATGPLLGLEANSSSVNLNKFSGTTGYTTFETFEGNNLVNQNNFNTVGQMHVANMGLGTLNAENNWWGDVNPADNVTGVVDSTPSEVVAFAQS